MPPPFAASLVLYLCAWLACGAARAQLPAPACVELQDDVARLACYDRLHGRAPSVAAPAPPPASITPAAPPPAAPGLAERWDLDGKRGPLFVPRVYRPVYLLPLTWTSQLNSRPSSPSPGHEATSDLPLRRVEAKYQLSLKAKLVDDLLGSSTSLWAGYTQSARWQVYRQDDSRPFRETNYEPELMLVRPLTGALLGWQMRMGSLSFTHESNGRSLPFSRSWNRLIASLALERGDWVAEIRPWLRLGEARSDDDNPDIQNHIGRAELLLTRHWGEHAFSLQLRHSLRTGANSRGSGQMDWVFPLSGALHGYFQAFSGYGESLIDYNLRQTKIGLGVTIAGWR